MRRALFALLTLLFAFSLRPHAGQAQVTATDSAAVLLQAAESFAARGQADVAQALYRFVVEHFPDTPAGSLADRRLSGIRAEGTEGSGSVELQVWTTTFGLYLGVAVPGALGADGSEPYGVGLLLGGPVGFFGGRALARAKKLTEGQARAITMGGSWGIWQAWGWRQVFDWGVGERCDPAPFDPSQEYCYSTEDESEEQFAATIVGGLGGMAAGYALSDRTVAPGVATAVNFGALWGSWFGVATGVFMSLEDDNLLAATLLGGNAGLVATAVMAPGWNVSRNRARLVSIAGVIGGLGGAGIDLLVQPDGEKTAIAIPLATSLIGLGMGIYTTRYYDAEHVDARSDEAPMRGALVDLREGRWRVSAPVPYPVMLEGQGTRGPIRVPGLAVTLFRASFR
jgi:hypothetical protein